MAQQRLAACLESQMVLAVQKAGCVSTGLSPLLMPHEMEHQLNDSGAKVLLTLDLLFGKVAEVAEKVDFTTVIVSSITDFLPGSEPGSEQATQKIPNEETKPLSGKTVISFSLLHQDFSLFY